jgi:RNA polymerase sigma factor (sigma-70 family)
MTNDAELLSRYADNRSEEAFAELVRRHVDLVYSSGLRQTQGDHHRAQELTQMVFIRLAQKASALARHPVLPAWLHRTSRLTALEMRRKEWRRTKYEHAAGAEAPSDASESGVIAWDEVRPVLDEAIDRLNEPDRQAILLRFFADHSFENIGDELSLSANTARMRVDRALEKLHSLLALRGIKSSTAAVAAALASQAVTAAPAGVATASTSAAIAAGSAGLAWFAFMSTAKAPAILTAALAVGGTAFIAFQEHSARQTAAEIADLARHNEAAASLKEDNERLSAASDQARNLQDEAATVRILREQVRDAEAAASVRARTANTKAAAALPSGEAIMDISKLDQRPVMLAQHRPDYPPSMRQAGLSGQAVVEFIVGSDGIVYNATAVSSTDPAFADSAVAAVSQWVFKPGQAGGQNVNTHMAVPIVFALSPSAPIPSAKSWF